MANFSEESRDTTKKFLEIFSELEESNTSGSSKGDGTIEELSLQHLKDLRKVLAELQLDLRKLQKNSSWDREKRLLCALLQAKLKRLELVDPFVDMEDIQCLTDIRSASEEVITHGISQGLIQNEPLRQFYSDAQILHQTVQEIRGIYEDLIDALTEVMGADWTKDQIQAQKQTNQSLWNDFLGKLQSVNDDLESTFSECQNGPEAELFALFKILNPNDSLTRADFEETLELTNHHGTLWEKAEELFHKYQNRIEQLLALYHEDEKNILKAHLLAQEGNFVQAQELLNLTSGSFADLPYDTVREEVLRWQQLSIQPLQEMARLLPGLPVADKSNESYNTLANQFPHLAKEYIRKKFSGFYNPIGLFLRSRRLQKQARKFSQFCENSLNEVEQSPASDFHSLIKKNWAIARDNSTQLVTEIQKQAWGCSIKKTLILSLTIACSFCGYQIFHFWKNLPDTGIRFVSSGIPLLKTTIKDKQNNVLKKWGHSTQGSFALSKIPPEEYQIQLEFENSFPIQIPVSITLGKISNITSLIQQEFEELQGRFIDFEIPFGSEITILNKDSGLIQTYKIEAETLSLELDYCKALDWYAEGGKMAIADRKGRILIVNSEDTFRIEGTIFVQGESFGSLRISRGNGVPLILAISENGSVYAWEIESGKMVAKLDHEGAKILSAAFDSQNQSVLTLDSNFQLRSWEIGTEKPTKTLNIDKENKASGDWELIRPHPAWFFDLPGGLKYSLSSTVQAAEILTLKESKEVMVSILNEDGQLFLWKGKDLESLEMLNLAPEDITAFAMHPSGEWLITSTAKGDLHKYQLSINGGIEEIKLQIDTEIPDFTQIQFDPTGQICVGVSSDGEIIGFSPNKPNSTFQLEVKSPIEAKYSIAPFAESVALYSLNNELQLWRSTFRHRVYLAEGNYDITIHSRTSGLLLKKSIQVTDGMQSEFSINDEGLLDITSPPPFTPVPVSRTGGISPTSGWLQSTTPSTPVQTSSTEGVSTTGGQQ